MGKYVICVSNRGYPASLEVGKVYRTLPDAGAALQGELRVVDEEGEDYVYPREMFEPIEVSSRARHAIDQRHVV